MQSSRMAASSMTLVKSAELPVPYLTFMRAWSGVVDLGLYFAANSSSYFKASDADISAVLLS